MRINGKRKSITLEDILSAGKSMDLRKTEAEEAITAVKNSLDKWSLFADQAEINSSDVKRIRNQFKYL